MNEVLELLKKKKLTKLSKVSYKNNLDCLIDKITNDFSKKCSVNWFKHIVLREAGYKIQRSKSKQELESLELTCTLNIDFKNEKCLITVDVENTWSAIQLCYNKSIDLYLSYEDKDKIRNICYNTLKNSLTNMGFDNIKTKHINVNHREFISIFQITL